jgi:hypothetical protein
VISISEYFNFLYDGVSVNGNPFIEDYWNDTYRSWSIQLNIPASWREIMMPDDICCASDAKNSRYSLPTRISARLNKLGFVAEKNHGGGICHAYGPRKYILRRHSGINITKIFYRDFIIPNYPSKWNGLRSTQFYVALGQALVAKNIMDNK